MAVFATIFGVFSLLCLLYSRLTNDSYGLLPFDWSITLEQFVWWGILYVAAWTVGTGLWQLWITRQYLMRSIIVGSAASAMCIVGALWYAHYADPGNELKIIRIVYPVWLSGATLLIAAALWLTQQKVWRNRVNIAEQSPDSLISGIPCRRNWSTSIATSWVHIAATVLSATFIVAGIVIYVCKKRLTGYPSFVAGFQIIELAYIFALPAALLQWTSLHARMTCNRRFEFIVKLAAIGLMGVAAFCI